MKRIVTCVGLVGALLVTAAAFAQAPASAPAGTTGVCKDGSNWTGPTKKGACRGHKGVATWYGAAAGAAAATTAATPAAAAPAAPATAAAPAAPTTTKSKAKSAAAPSGTPAPGGGPGLVWVNTPTKVYHCPGTKWYGTTKEGSYMSESAAIAAGDHADHGKACKAQ